jgi:hypothetical protein
MLNLLVIYYVTCWFLLSKNLKLFPLNMLEFQIYANKRLVKFDV